VVGLRKGQVWGFQFHPEKSHARGRVLLREWLREAGFSVRPEPVPVEQGMAEEEEGVYVNGQIIPRDVYEQHVRDADEMGISVEAFVGMLYN
jgi:hypothetical protein